VNGTYFLFTCTMALGGYILGRYHMNRFHNGKMAWIYDEQSIADQMREDGWRTP
jgi:hypothetical protein